MLRGRERKGRDVRKVEGIENGFNEGGYCGLYIRLDFIYRYHVTEYPVHVLSH